MTTTGRRTPSTSTQYVFFADAIEEVAEYVFFGVGNDAIAEGNVEQGFEFGGIERPVVGEDRQRSVGQFDVAIVRLRFRCFRHVVFPVFRRS